MLRFSRLCRAKAPWPPLALLSLLLAPGCESKTIEEREREAADAISRSIQDVDSVALAQQVDPAVVKEVQQHLTAVHEYQGEINGKLDAVTINALQAFERSQDLRDDGIIDGEVRERLAAAARGAAKTGG
jgi:peptidoglycan hydrolase-like protein with peptidoglycan-binding domain